MVKAARVLVGMALVWTSALLTAPSAIASSHASLSRMAALVYVAGGVVCHQRPERSFHAHGHPLPVCARCTGLYVSALAGGLLALALAPRRSSARERAGSWRSQACRRRSTWLAEAAGLAHPSNMARAAAALSLGAAAAWVVVATMASDRV